MEKLKNELAEAVQKINESLEKGELLSVEELKILLLKTLFEEEK